MSTRFYFPYSELPKPYIEPVFGTPGLSTDWNGTDGATRRRMTIFKGNSAITTGNQINLISATGAKHLDRQLISDPLEKQYLDGFFSGQLMVREYTNNDDIVNFGLYSRVVDATGGLRGAFRGLGSYGTESEFINNSTHRNKTLNQSTLSGVQCQKGDRIVIELGYRTNIPGTTPQATAKWGENAADLPVNNTQTTNGAGWFGFSKNIKFLTDSIINMGDD